MLASHQGLLLCMGYILRAVLTAAHETVLISMDRRDLRESRSEPAALFGGYEMSLLRKKVASSSVSCVRG